MRKVRRWAVLLAPLVLPWVIVTWDAGWYVVFSAFWVDPGPRFVTMAEFLARTTASLLARDVALTWPLAFGFYLLGLLGTVVSPARRHVSASAFFLAGLGVGFYALGITRQAGLLGLPVGTIVLWIVALVGYRKDPESPTRTDEG